MQYQAMAKRRKRKSEDFAVGVGRALRHAAKEAQKVARMHNTPLYYWENGKVVARKPWLSKSSRGNISGGSGGINRSALAGREPTTGHRLYLSFWDICLDNLPHGMFQHVAITSADARALIRTARATKRLTCVSKDDLLAPYRERERLRHEELCAVLRSHHDCPLHLDDFLLSFGGKESADQGIAPLELAELQPGERLLVVMCGYRLVESVERNMDPQQRFVLADDSVAFHLITALHPREAPWET